MTSKEYNEKIQRELDWWNKNQKRRSLISKFLNSKLFYDYKRCHYSYILSKKTMSSLVWNYLEHKPVNKMLIAPCGDGDDYKYFNLFSKEIYGIDLSSDAIKRCPETMNLKSGDILKSSYPDNYFDLIISNLFFHHLIQVGFDPFLKEFYRILKPGGKIGILDFSIFYPLNAFTRTLKNIFNNPFGEVKEENPYRPKLMIDALKRTKYKQIISNGGTFSHCLYHIPLAKVIHFFSKALLNKKPFKNFAWTIIYLAQKPFNK